MTRPEQTRPEQTGPEQTGPETPRRGLIVGTSHCAALRLASKAWPADWPGMAIDFAALQGDLAEFQVAGQTLTVRTDAARDKLRELSGQSEFDLTAYDFVAVCGGTPSTFHAARLYAVARWPGLPSVVAAPLTRPGVTLVSQRCFELALTGIIRSAPAFTLLDQIRGATAARRFVIPHPALSRLVLTQTRQHQGFVQIHRCGDAQALTDMLDQAAEAACGDLATCLRPPPEVRKDHFFTHPQFHRGATRLGAQDNLPQPPEDYLHGNAAYGRHILSALHAAL